MDTSCIGRSEMQEKDIFDRIMELPVLRIVNPFYKKNKEILLYLFFGGLTFLVSISSYAVFNIRIGWNALTANIASWILAVAFAYVTNRTWVFESSTDRGSTLIKEITGFVGGRIATLVIYDVFFELELFFMSKRSIIL